jgi:cytochrome P450
MWTEISPFATLRTVATAFLEWGQYMHEIYLAQVDASQKGTSGHDDDGLDLMGAMVRSSGAVPSATKPKPGASLSKSEILGNSFVMFLAGHETAANSIHFAILFLACNPETQQKLQQDLDEILRDAPAGSKDWDYDTYLPKLFAGWPGAIMNEQLRLLPPVVNIPKSTSPHLPPQPIKVNGKDCIIAPGTTVNLNTICAHRNPKYWPAGPARAGKPFHSSNTSTDLEEFKPERWFVSHSDGKTKADKHLTQDSDKDTGVDLSPDTAATMFSPIKGAYIPFSEGFRACLGRRFAQVEILAALAVVYKDHSVELFVDEEDQVQRMSQSERAEKWDVARSEVERKINEESSTIITLQMRGAPVKLRVCPRGQELFIG